MEGGQHTWTLLWLLIFHMVVCVALGLLHFIKKGATVSISFSFPEPWKGILKLYYDSQWFPLKKRKHYKSPSWVFPKESIQEHLHRWEAVAFRGLVPTLTQVGGYQGNLVLVQLCGLSDQIFSDFCCSSFSHKSMYFHSNCTLGESPMGMSRKNK